MNKDRQVTVTVTNRVVKTTDYIAIGGNIVPPGSLVEASAYEAVNLIGRRRAVPATDAEVAGAGSIIATGTIDNGPDLRDWRTAAAWGN